MTRLSTYSTSYLVFIFVFSYIICPAQNFTDTKNNDAVFGSKDNIPFSLTGNIYFLKKGTKKLPKSFDINKSKGSIHTTELNISSRSFDKGFPGVTNRMEWFAIDYNGFFYIDKTQTIEFYLISDDGSKLFINNRLVIDNDGQHRAYGSRMRIKLYAGIHQMRLQYFQGPRYNIALQLLYRTNSENDFTVFNFDEFSPVNITKPKIENIAAITPNEEITFEDTTIFTVEINNMVLFDFNQWKLKNEAKIVLNEIYHTYAQNNPNIAFIIEGHTDDSGSDDYNLELSSKRAKSVAQFMENQYPMQNRIWTIGYGENKPKYNNTNEAQRAKNRRVEIQIMQKETALNYYNTHQ